MMHITDVKAVSHLMDYFILVVSCGRTSQGTVQEALRMAPLVSEKLLGAVLNHADPTPRRAGLFRQARSYGRRNNRGHEDISFDEGRYGKSVTADGGINARNASSG
jgi:Mrp family chromosome partitioning ATPase